MHFALFAVMRCIDCGDTMRLVWFARLPSKNELGHVLGRPVFLGPPPFQLTGSPRSSCVG
jgi:hypothetical protein